MKINVCKLLVAIILAASTLGLFSAAVASETVTVFAAASLANAIEEIGNLFSASEKGRIVPSLASSSTLAKQIEGGAPANVFISADQEWMDYLASRRLIVQESRFDLLGNRLVIIAPFGSTKKIDVKPGFPLAKLLGQDRLATGDPDHVPAGKYAKIALEKFGVWPEIQGKLARADNVRAALALVERGECPLGIVYSTDAAISKKVAVVGTFPADSHTPITYPAALVAGNDTSTARQFLEFLKAPQARAVFEKYGFVVR